MKSVSYQHGSFQIFDTKYRELTGEVINDPIGYRLVTHGRADRIRAEDVLERLGLTTDEYGTIIRVEKDERSVQ